jgi:hypothetical protein
VRRLSDHVLARRSTVVGAAIGILVMIGRDQVGSREVRLGVRPSLPDAAPLSPPTAIERKADFFCCITDGWLVQR